MLAGVCLALAASATSPTVFVPVQQVTLAWTHSIEKIRWEEDYSVRPAVPPQTGWRLQPGKARIQGSGAGMEPPPDAVWRHGAYEYQPQTPPQTVLRLTRSGFTPDYDWCVGGRCQPLQQLIPTDGGVTLMWACGDAASKPPGVAE
jgi:hypothetical protein